MIIIMTSSTLTSLKLMLDRHDIFGLVHKLHQECLPKVEPGFKVCRMILEQLLTNENSSKQSSIQKFKNSEFLADFIWEKLNTGHYSNVLPEYRQIYSLISMVKVLYLVYSLDHDTLNPDVLKDLIKILDMGLIMGGPLENDANSKLAGKLHFFIEQKIEKDELLAKKRKIEYTCSLIGQAPNVDQIDEFEDLDLSEFVERYRIPERNFKIRDFCQTWKAFSKWNLDYFKRKFGFRTVPIEIGNKYTDESWTQTLMTINEFITDFIEDPKAKSVGYLAQHEIFYQIPELKEDLEIPDFCYSENDFEPNLNFWFGPKNTTTPLHTDPKHNVLVQIFGYKYVRLYPQKDSGFLYPNPGMLLNNTSMIDIEEDFEKLVKTFPDFAKAKGLECILGPGDLLYIPPKCWHFVKSLSTSCSISFWFD